MYGTRDAAQNWERAYGDFMAEAGFEIGKASPCIFIHRDRGLRVVVHGDDFTILGDEQQLNWFRQRIKTRFEVKCRGRIGGDEGDDKSIRILNRIVTWTEAGIEYEVDQRHAEIIMKQCGLSWEDRSVATPSVPRDSSRKEDASRKEQGEEGEDELEAKEATLYRGITARANYIAQDRMDIRYAVKEMSRHMAKPRRKDIAKIKRLARYLIGCPRMVQLFRRQKASKKIDVYTDSNWAGCLETRKSTSGGIIKIGHHAIKTWSSTQNVIATSSGEAEFYALVKAGSQSLGIKAMADDFGIKINRIVIKTDASAAKGISMRRGIGQVKHIEVNQLWIQDKVRNGDIEVEKIPGKTNPADALTKECGVESLDCEKEGCELVARAGRHPLAPVGIDSEKLEVLRA